MLILFHLSFCTLFFPASVVHLLLEGNSSCGVYPLIEGVFIVELLALCAFACTSQEVTYELLFPFSSSCLGTAGSATARHLYRSACSLTGICHLVVPLCFATVLTLLCDIILQFINWTGGRAVCLIFLYSQTGVSAAAEIDVEGDFEKCDVWLSCRMTT